MSSSKLKALLCGDSSMSLDIVLLAKAVNICVSYLWDPNCGNLQKRSKELGITDQDEFQLDKILSDTSLELVIVILPPVLQPSIIDRCVQFKKHVVIGLPAVPLNPTATSGLTSPSAPNSHSSQSMLFYAQYLRFIPSVREARSFMNSGKLGRLYVIEMHLASGPLVNEVYDWTCDAQMGGGILNIHGAMLLDLVWFCTNRSLINLDGILKCYTRQTGTIKGIRNITADDFCVIMGELEEPKNSGNSTNYVSQERTSLLISINSHASAGQFDLEITFIGSEGRLLVRNNDLYFAKNSTSSCETEVCLHDSALELAKINEMLMHDQQNNDPNRATLFGDKDRMTSCAVMGWYDLLDEIHSRLTRQHKEEWLCARPSDWMLLEKNMVRCSNKSARRLPLGRINQFSFSRPSS